MYLKSGQRNKKKENLSVLFFYENGRISVFLPKYAFILEEITTLDSVDNT